MREENILMKAGQADASFSKAIDVYLQYVRGLETATRTSWSRQSHVFTSNDPKRANNAETCTICTYAQRARTKD